MEQERWSTPSKVQKVDSPLINNLWMHRTPVKQGEMRLKHALETRYNNAQSLPFTGLPIHVTPPSKLRKLITKNPFEPDLTNRLHLPVISPTVFAKVSSPMQESPGFKWNIDELARIKPAKIEEFPVHQVHSPDPELEIKAQAAIDRFFKQNHIIPSPWDIRQKENKSLNIPNRSLDDLNSTKDLSKSKKDAWSQTVLSLPFDLPQNVKEVLKPFFTFTQEQNTDGDDVNLSNNSLRRKLFFNHDECTDNDSFISLSPVKRGNSMTLSCSPAQSGMFVHGTPLKKLLQTRQNNKSSMVKSKSISPPDMSPIHTTEKNILYEKIARNSRSAIRLDFAMDMSIDSAVVEKSGHSINDISLDETNMKHTEDNHEIIVHNDKKNVCDSDNMEELPRCIDSADTNTVYFDAALFNNEGHNRDIDLKTKTKIKTEIESFVQENHKQSNAMFGMFEQQSTSNSVQDTGYQTYSMNNTMHTVNNYSNISANYKTRWNEQVTSKDNNTQLSWRENIVFSSTPSRCNKN